MSPPSGPLHYSRPDGERTLCGRVIGPRAPRLTSDPTRVECRMCQRSLTFEVQLSCGDVIDATPPDATAPVRAVIEAIRFDAPGHVSYIAWLSAEGGTTTLTVRPIEADVSKRGSHPAAPGSQ